MSLRRATSLVAVVIFLSGILSTLPAPAQADPEIEIEIDDVLALPGDAGFPVPVFLRNYEDTVAAFELWLGMSKPGITEFDLKVDTVGCLIGGWDYIDIRTYSGTERLDVKVTSIADITNPYTNRGFAPQDGVAPLFKLSASVLDDPDPFADPTVGIEVLPVFDNFGLSDPQGNSLCVLVVPVLDTICYRCLQWSSPPDVHCVIWQEVTEPPCDSAYIYVHNEGRIDSSKVAFIDGSITLAPVVCGNLDGSVDESVDGIDLSYMLDYLFISLEPLQLQRLGNVDGSPDGDINGIDLSVMLDHLFIDFSELECSGLQTTPQR